MRPDPDDHTPGPGGLEDIFRVVIAENPRVCKRCFRRTGRRERFPDEPGYAHADILAFVDEVVPPGATWSILDVEFYEDVRLVDRLEHGATPSSRQRCPDCETRGYIFEDDETPGGRVAQTRETCKRCDGIGYVDHLGGKATNCANCGAVDYHRSPPPRSKDDAVTAAASLSVTLEEYGIPVDWPLLMCFVKHAKGVPSLAGNDFKVFSEATARVVRRTVERSDEQGG